MAACNNVNMSTAVLQYQDAVESGVPCATTSKVERSVQGQGMTWQLAYLLASVSGSFPCLFSKDDRWPWDAYSMTIAKYVSS